MAADRRVLLLLQEIFDNSVNFLAEERKMYRMPRVLAASVASNAARSNHKVVTALRPLSHLSVTIRDAETAPSARRNLLLAPRLPSFCTPLRSCSTQKEQTKETVVPDEVIIDGEKAIPEETTPPEPMTNDETAKGSSTTHEVCPNAPEHEFKEVIF